MTSEKTKIKRHNLAKNLLVDGYRPVEFDRIKENHPSYTTELIHAMNYAAYVFETEELKSYAKEYGVTVDADLSGVPAWELPHLGTVSWLLLNEAWFSDVKMLEFKHRLKELEEKYSEKTDNVVKFSQDKLNTNRLIGELEGLIDDGSSDKVGELISSISKFNRETVLNHFKRQLDDTQHEEYNTKDKPSVVLTLQTIVACLSSENKSEAKPKAQRIKKVKPRKIVPSKMVRKLKYLKVFDSEDLKLKSIHPEKIVGASVLWVYNTKTRKLGKYVACDGSGLMVKGSSITNYDVDSSVAKTIRKPKEILDTLSALGKVEQRKFLDSVKAVASPLTGRMNNDIIIFKVG